MDIAGWQFTPFIVPVLGAAIFAVALALFAWRRREDAAGTWVFLVLVALAAWWSFTYALELATTDPDTMFLWVKMEWITIALLPVALLLFALVYTGHGRFVTLRNVALLMILPLTMITLAWTTPAHTLLYADPGVVDNGSFIAFYAQRGPAFYVHVVYGYILLLAAVFLMARAWRRAQGEARKLAFLVLLGSLVAFFGNIAYQTALLLGLPVYVDLTVLALLLSIVFFAWGWFRFRWTDIVPELRETGPRAGRRRRGQSGPQYPTAHPQPGLTHPGGAAVRGPDTHPDPPFARGGLALALHGRLCGPLPHPSRRRFMAAGAIWATSSRVGDRLSGPAAPRPAHQRADPGGRPVHGHLRRLRRHSL